MKYLQKSIKFSDYDVVKDLNMWRQFNTLFISNKYSLQLVLVLVKYEPNQGFDNIKKVRLSKHLTNYIKEVCI